MGMHVLHQKAPADVWCMPGLRPADSWMLRLAPRVIWGVDDPRIGSLDPIAQQLRVWIAEAVQEALRTERERTVLQEYLSTRQAASLANVSQGTIRRWIRDGRLEAKGAGRELRVEHEKLMALMNEGRRRRSEAPESPEAHAMRLLGLSGQ